jgi:hypothetical protein
MTKDDDDMDDPKGADASDDSPPASSGAAAVVLPFATAIAALALGAVLGGVIGWVSKPAEVVQVEVPRSLTADEMNTACAPTVETKVAELTEAQNKIAFLEKEVADRESRVRELQSGAAKPAAPGGPSASAQLAQAKKDLAEALSQLEVARQEKEQLVAELTQTKEQLVKTEEALVVQTKSTERAKEDALVNKWYRFVNDAQLEVCEKGSRKKLGNCREIVSASLLTNANRDKFAHCVRSGQAVPSVRELEKDEGVPAYAELMNVEEKDLKGWHILFCDPSLPERSDGFLNETPLPGGVTASRN